MKASATVDIERPIEEVFDFVSNVENMEQWVVGMGETKLVVGDGENVGDRYESRYSYGGRTSDMEFEITTYEPPHRFGMTAPEGPFAFDGLVELEETDRGTLVTNTIDAGADGRVTAFVFAVFGPIVRWMMARQLRKELRVLEELLEGSGDSPPDGGQTDVAGA